MTILFVFTWLMDEIKYILSLFYPFVEIKWMMAEARLSFRPPIIIKITFLTYFDRREQGNPQFFRNFEIPERLMIHTQVNFESCQVRTWSYKFLILTWAPLIVYQQDWVILSRSMWGHQKVKNFFPKKLNHFQVKMVREF